MLEPMPAVWMRSEVRTAGPGSIFMKIKKRGIQRTPPPIPIAETIEAMAIPAGRAIQGSVIIFAGVEVEAVYEPFKGAHFLLEDVELLPDLFPVICIQIILVEQSEGGGY